MMDKVGDFRRPLDCLGRANLRMGPPQPFPLAVSGKITQIFLETQVIWGMSVEWTLAQVPFPIASPFPLQAIGTT